MAITSPIQFLVVAIILLVQIGKASLVGMAFILVFSLLQTQIARYLYMLRKKSMIWTDARMQLLSELLRSIKIVKLMAWELPFLGRLGDIRVKEISFVKSLLITRAGSTAVSTAMPNLGESHDVWVRFQIHMLIASYPYLPQLRS
jgi:ABC-type bacteriocin/lantibiotic exporter with double-glycine peptidase domain